MKVELTATINQDLPAGEVVTAIRQGNTLIVYPNRGSRKGVSLKTGQYKIYQPEVLEAPVLDSGPVGALGDEGTEGDPTLPGDTDEDDAGAPEAEENPFPIDDF